MAFSVQEYWSELHLPFRGIFPTQGSNPGRLHCRRILYRLSHWGGPFYFPHLCVSASSQLAWPPQGEPLQGGESASNGIGHMASELQTSGVAPPGGSGASVFFTLRNPAVGWVGRPGTRGDFSRVGESEEGARWGLCSWKTRRPAAWLLVSSVPAPGEAGGFQAGSPSLCLSLPQGFVLAVTIIREAVEEIRCYMRDKEVNSQVYSRLTARGEPPAAQPQGGGGRGGHRVPTRPRAADAQGAEFTARAGGVWAAGAGQSLSGRRQGGQLCLGPGGLRPHPWAVTVPLWPVLTLTCALSARINCALVTSSACSPGPPLAEKAALLLVFVHVRAQRWCLGVCLTLCDHMDCSPLVSSVRGILQTRILERVAVSSFWGSSRPRD